MNLTTYFHLVLSLIKNGDTLLHPLCALIVWTGKNLSIFSLLRLYIVNLLYTRNKCDHPLDQFDTDFYSGVCAYIPSSFFFHLLGHITLYRGADKSLTRPGRKQPRKHVRDARDFNNIVTQAVIKIPPLAE